MNPVSRSDMQARRAAKIESDRQQFVKQTIETIYKTALHAAETTTSYTYLVNYSRIAKIPDTRATMLFDNSTEIIEQLRILFPDCTVKYTTKIKDNDGVWQEESAITEAITTFIRNYQDAIIIDWS